MDYKVTVNDVLETLEKYCIRKECDLFTVNNVFEAYMKNTDVYKEEHSRYLIENGKPYVLKNKDIYYYFMSFFLQATKDKEIYKELVEYCIWDKTITKENKYFIYSQIMRYNFMNLNVIDEETEDTFDNLYSCIYEAYSNEFIQEYSFIPKEERNKDFVMVFICQVLGMGHGPTKTLLDRCYILEEYLNKKVYIVNTAELLPCYGAINFFNTVGANYIEQFNQKEYFSYKDRKFPFLQCPNMMPQVSIIGEILDVVRSEKPYFILTIGGNSIVNDVCSNIVPTITIGTVPSGRTETRGQFQTIGRRITEEDRRWLKKHHFTEQHIIESLFTSAFKEQSHHYTREQLGLPENRFIVLLVGGRLDEEIDEQCMSLLKRLTEADIFVAFMGKFNKYQEYIKSDEQFKKHTKYLGFQDDVLAVNECCDLYMNPKRVGGGTSAAEALYKGLPVVAFDYGDVGVGAGSDFHVKDYDDMYNQIIKYATDKDYYQQMSEKAKKRAEYLTDSKGEFVKIIRTAEQSEHF